MSQLGKKKKVLFTEGSMQKIKMELTKNYQN